MDVQPLDHTTYPKIRVNNFGARDGPSRKRRVCGAPPPFDGPFRTPAATVVAPSNFSSVWQSRVPKDPTKISQMRAT